MGEQISEWEEDEKAVRWKAGRTTTYWGLQPVERVCQ